MLPAGRLWKPVAKCAWRGGGAPLKVFLGALQHNCPALLRRDQRRWCACFVVQGAAAQRKKVPDDRAGPA